MRTHQLHISKWVLVDITRLQRTRLVEALFAEVYLVDQNELGVIFDRKTETEASHNPHRNGEKSNGDLRVITRLTIELVTSWKVDKESLLRMS